ncbi:GtrA family protein [uncultured Thiothrix sp.]|uniref:GtrA family protein n=1 Tax=uncultured Thiothrix sp. TaxID=223185 RepID=UPI00262F73D3|nr:GtrA family protein [uncultured Thiothrix sp.]
MNTIKKELLKSLLASGLAFIADFMLLILLTHLFNLNYIFSIIIAFIFGAWINYTLSIRWVFTYRSLENKSLEFSIFFLVGVVTLLTSIILMIILVDILGIHILMAKITTTGLTFIANFIGRRLLLFGKKSVRNQAIAVLIP